MEQPGLDDRPAAAARRPLVSAEVLSIGSELTVGDTRDTNAGELARSMTDLGLVVGRLTALPDRLAIVRTAVEDALARVDLIVTTGGLGPTPDDLTREAIAEALGEQPAVDPVLERWLRDLFDRRHLPFPEANIKQAWLIPSAQPIPNPHGTAPGWFVETGEGRVIVALPGPPREMRPLWHEWVVPRLAERGFGRREVRRTYRLAGIGESLVASLLGESLLRATNPIVATYARAEAVDVRIAAADEPGGDGGPQRSAEDAFAEAEAAVLAAVGKYVWGHGDETWTQAIGRALAERGWTLSLVEVGTAGAMTALLGEGSWLRYAEVLAPDSRVAKDRPAAEADLLSLARLVRSAGRSEVGVALRTASVRGDTRAEIAVAAPGGERAERRTAFLGGSQGRTRAALAAAAVLLETIRSDEASSGAAAAVETGRDRDPAIRPTPPPATSEGSTS